MSNPKAELREYLDRLIHRYLNIKSLYQQLKSIFEWQTPARIEALNLGVYFFQLVTYGLSHTVLVELSMLLSEKEERSLRDWLKKAKEHVASVKPTRYNANYSKGERQPIKPEEYRAIIDDQIAQLDDRKDIINRIKARRDKAIAHLEKAYFDDPKALERDYPLGNDDIDDLIEVVGSILRKHHSCLFETDMRMEVVSVHTIDTVLQYARAFMRARRDFNLIEKGFRPEVYMRDEYEGELYE
jgi:hypothetical protein